MLVDQRLPAPFRTRVKTLIAQRLKGAGYPSEIALEQVSFPVKNPPYLEAREYEELLPVLTDCGALAANG